MESGSAPPPPPPPGPIPTVLKAPKGVKSNSGSAPDVSQGAAPPPPKTSAMTSKWKIADKKTEKPQFKYSKFHRYRSRICCNIEKLKILFFQLQAQLIHSTGKPLKI
jgi:hypothetical protein